MQNIRPNQFNQKQMPVESPQVYKERVSVGSEFQHISPIPTLSVSEGGGPYLFQNSTNEKQGASGGRIQFLSSGGSQLSSTNKNGAYNSNKQVQQYGAGARGADQLVISSEGETPNTMLMKEFYRRPPTGLGTNKEDFYLESYDDDVDSSEGLSSGDRNFPVAKAHGAYGVVGHDMPHPFSANSNALGLYSNQPLIKSAKSGGQGTVECTDFDLTAKEISSNKRGIGNNQGQKNTILSGKSSHSPMVDGAPSNSETVKWAFSNKDSQETQKKISIINRESLNNHQDIISRSLKSHDSRTQQLQCQTSSSQNTQGGFLKGKMLDFANMDPSPNNIESALLYSSSKVIPQQILMTSGTESSPGCFDDRTEHRIGSFSDQERRQFLDNEDEMIISSRAMTNGKQQSLKQAIKEKALAVKSKFIPSVKKAPSEALKNLIDNTIECPFCNEHKVFDSSLQCSKIEEPKNHADILRENLEKKYLTSREYYNVKIINDIIYNESTHIVSVFKDYLIYDDISEFLKRFYQHFEGVQRLPKMFEFYEKYSKVFPNYVILPENKYLFKNIEKKQRIIDEKQNFLLEQQKRKQNPSDELGLNTSGDRKHHQNRHKDRFSSQNHPQNSSSLSSTSNNRMFDTRFINSVANIKPSGFIDQSQSQSRIMMGTNSSQYQEHLQNSSILIHQQLQQNMENAAAAKKKRKLAGLGGLEDLDFDELISKFIAKDSESNIQLQQQSTIIISKTQQDQTTTGANNGEGGENRPQPGGNGTKKVYEYQEKALQEIAKPYNEMNTGAGSIASSDQQRPVSGKPLNIESNCNSGKRLSNDSHKAASSKCGANDKQSQKVINDLREAAGKILNYNIYNNYNQYINNENYYISTDKLATKLINEQPPAGTGIQQQQPQKQESLQRSQSRGNLHSQQQQMVPSSKHQQPATETCQTPLKNTGKREVITPVSGGAASLAEKRAQLVGTKFNKGAQHHKAGKQHDDHPLQQPLPTNKSSSSLQRSDNQQQQQYLAGCASSNSPLNSYGAKIAATHRPNTEALTSRELSKERKPPQLIVPNQKQYPSSTISNQQHFQGLQTSQSQSQLLQTQQLPGTAPANQMFKNELLLSLASKLQESQQQSKGPDMATVRTVERLRNIEEEIEKDYSKYVNEYGLTKTAFAKAVNQIREKQQQQQQQQLRLSDQQQQHQPISKVQSLPTSTRQARMATNCNSGEKKRGLSGARSGSTSSQQRKGGNGSLQRKHQQLENVNELYMNTNSVRTIVGGGGDKQIRSVRTKTPNINSQNSSSCQRSQKLSPDKNFIIANQFPQGQHPPVGFSQTLAAAALAQSQLNQTPSSSSINPNAAGTYITLKATQPSKAGKGLKIKFPQQPQQPKEYVSQNTNTSSNQTPKRIKLSKTKSSSHIPISNTSRGTTSSSIQQPIASLISTARGARLGGIPDMVILDDQQMMNQCYQGPNGMNLRGSQAFEPQQLLLDGQLPAHNQVLQSMLFPSSASGYQQHPIVTNSTNSAVGTYATTSILNSPLSFKHQAIYQHPQNLQQQQQQPSRQSSKGAKPSRNGANSQHQSQKSIGGGNTHQRASSSNNLLQISSGKIKQVKGSQTIAVPATGESKRMSAGSNLSKKGGLIPQGGSGPHHQQTSSSIQQQILQLLMSYQSQENLGDSSSQQQQLQTQYLPFSQTLKGSGMNSTQSMKDLKSIKQQAPAAATLLKDLQIIKASKQKLAPGQQQQLNTQRCSQQQQQPGTIIMLNQQNFKKAGGKSSGKHSSRGGGESSKKRLVAQQHQQNPYLFNDCTHSQYSQMQTTTNELSSRIAAALGGSDMSTSNFGQNATGVGYSGTSGDSKRMLSYSKSQENLDLIKFAAQRAALEQQSSYLQQPQQINIPPNKFLQNLKNTETAIQLSKLKLIQQQQQPVAANMHIQSARNLQYEQQQQPQRNTEYDAQTLGGPRGPTNIIIGSNFGCGADRSQSRRTSGKFNPSSTKSQQ